MYLSLSTPTPHKYRVGGDRAGFDKTLIIAALLCVCVCFVVAVLFCLLLLFVFFLLLFLSNLAS